ncbi:hypothetical protein [Methanobrevibacter arboriphilus]|uniref:hypothetical protein n=1 Tax=Methanobrevibacter arboriphilus TaxID=39441 RepID=UPI000B1120C3|nr:hypothetical protein [Methanobrevibacter arboriphilus]
MVNVHEFLKDIPRTISNTFENNTSEDNGISEDKKIFEDKNKNISSFNLNGNEDGILKKDSSKNLIIFFSSINIFYHSIFNICYSCCSSSYS